MFDDIQDLVQELVSIFDLHFSFLDLNLFIVLGHLALSKQARVIQPNCVVKCTNGWF